MLRRLRDRGELATPARGFHVIVPPEHRAAGCRPAIEFIDELAAFLDTPYYVALLSSAELHGAAHQRPQVTQVMVRSRHRDIRCGSVRVDFALRENTAAIPVVVKNTPTGTVRVATPEATAIDLVGYVNRGGGLDNVATVLKELAEDLSGPKLDALADLSPRSWMQRLGYLLERVGAAELAAAVEAVVMGVPPSWVRLDPGGAWSGTRSARWRLWLNRSVEADL